MMKKVFKFIVFSYNQSKYMKETLESIKYQIEKYGEMYDLEYFIHIYDDASNDDTLDKAMSWYKNLANPKFQIALTSNRQNEGTVFNFKKTLLDTSYEYMFEMAGDDILCSQANVIEAVLSLKENEFKIGPILFLENQKITVGNEMGMRRLYYSMKKHKNRSKLIDAFRMGTIAVNSPSWIYSNKYYAEVNGEEILKGYRLLEDAPFFYEILKCNKIKITYYEKPLLIYRIHNESVSHSENNEIYDKDVHKLIDLYQKESSNTIWKKYFELELKDLNTFSLLFHFINRIEAILFRIKFFCFYKRGYIAFKRGLDQCAKQENAFYQKSRT